MAKPCRKRAIEICLLISLVVFFPHVASSVCSAPSDFRKFGRTARTDLIFGTGHSANCSALSHRATHPDALAAQRFSSM
jgi:hypothetical protein